MKKVLLLIAAVLAAGVPAIQAANLGIGDSAPALQASRWVKGGPVDALDPAKTYVVEFWATWCGPCRSTIPHLTEMAQAFPDVTFIGMNVWERGADPVTKVTQFVADMGAKMDYAVAMDTADQFMAKNWMEAAGQNGIPAAFVVDQGQIVWIGHPMGGLETTLKAVQAGTFDMATARKRAEAETRVEAFMARAMEGATDKELAEEGRALEALDAELGGLNPDSGKFVAADMIQAARFQKAMRAYQQGLFSQVGAEELAKLEAAARAAAPADLDFEGITRNMKTYFEQNIKKREFAELVEKYTAAAGADRNAELAAELARQIEALDLQDPEALNDLAWDILTSEKFPIRDLPFATRLAKQALEATGGQQGHILDTYARALFDAGQVAEAIEYQKRAVAASPGDAEIQAALARYQAAAETAP